MASSVPPDPYQSARDLPTVVELLKQLKGFKTLTRFIARDQRASILAIERQLEDLVKTVDEFYELLGSRHWIFHDNLNSEVVKGLLTMPAEKAEQELIAQYRNSETLGFMIQRLWRFPEMQARRRVIERALEDYEAERFDSTVLLLLTVMDGFVNDVETNPRRGLHTRSDDEMSAWDSVVGHHLGLSRAHRTFTKTISKTSDEEVHDLYRNGIMHGMLTNFNNVVVATKAWNRLFAVADWALSREKQAIEPDPTPSWRELIGQIAQNQRTKKAIAAWQARTLIHSDPDFECEPVRHLATAVLEAWKANNYGQIATHLASLTRKDTQNQSAGGVRNEYAPFKLQEFHIVRLNFVAPAICEIDADLTLDAETKSGRMRWVRETDNGEPAVLGDKDGEWRLLSTGPLVMFSNYYEPINDFEAD